RSLLGHQHPVCCVSWSPDGEMLASAGFDGFVRLWDAKTAKPLQTLRHATNNHAKCVSWSPDGKLLASAGYSSVRLWEAKTGKPLRTLQGEFSHACGLSWSPDG